MATRLTVLRNVIVIICPVVGSLVNVPTELDVVDAFVVKVVVLDPLRTVIVGAVAEVGAPEKVPIAFAPVAFVVAVSVFDPAVTVIVG